MLPKKENSLDLIKSHDTASEKLIYDFDRLTKLGMIMFWIRMIARTDENFARGVYEIVLTF